MDFGWDEGKRQAVFNDRKIDFEDMAAAFDGRPRVTYPSSRNDEDRLVSIAEVDGKPYAVVWLWRGDTIWIVTARRAWKSEVQMYRNAAVSTGERNGRQDRP